MRKHQHSLTSPALHVSPARRTQLVVLGCAAAVAVALGGCGGSSSSALSKPQLVAKVNPICGSLRSAAIKITVPSDFTSNPVAAAGYLDQVVKLADVEYKHLKALTPDSSVKSDYNDFLASVGQDLASLKSGDAKAHAKDPTGISVLRDEGIHSNDITRPQAANLGFTVCAKQRSG
jgi:hypothetical protein